MTSTWPKAPPAWILSLGMAGGRFEDKDKQSAQRDQEKDSIMVSAGLRVGLKSYGRGGGITLLGQTKKAAEKKPETGKKRTSEIGCPDCHEPHPLGSSGGKMSRPMGKGEVAAAVFEVVLALAGETQ